MSVLESDYILGADGVIKYKNRSWCQPQQQQPKSEKSDTFDTSEPHGYPLPRLISFIQQRKSIHSGLGLC